MAATPVRERGGATPPCTPPSSKLSKPRGRSAERRETPVAAVYFSNPDDRGSLSRERDREHRKQPAQTPKLSAVKASRSSSGRYQQSSRRPVAEERSRDMDRGRDRERDRDRDHSHRHQHNGHGSGSGSRQQSSRSYYAEEESDAPQSEYSDEMPPPPPPPKQVWSAHRHENGKVYYYNSRYLTLLAQYCLHCHADHIAAPRRAPGRSLRTSRICTFPPSTAIASGTGLVCVLFFHQPSAAANSCISALFSYYPFMCV